MTSPAEYAPARHDDEDAGYREPLSPRMKLVVLVAVVFFHVGGAWALISVEPTKLVVGDENALEVRLVPADQPPAPQLDTPAPEDTPPPEPEPVRLDTPPPDDTPPPEVPLLEAAVAAPTPDLPPPEFPAVAKPPPQQPPKPKPPPPPPRPRPAATPEAAPQAGPPAVPAAPKTVSASQVAYLNPPNAVYPIRSRKAGEQGRVVLRVLVDATGRPAQVSLAQTSGHPALDESALSAVRASSFRPYREGGVAQSVWVNVPIDFVLR
jgi:protein TonB